jgi:hypothetical protein
LKQQYLLLEEAMLVLLQPSAWLWQRRIWPNGHPIADFGLRIEERRKVQGARLKAM